MSDNHDGAKLRATAAQIVDAVSGSGRSLDDALTGYQTQVAADDRALLRFLCYGTLRYHWRLRAWIDVLLERQLKASDHSIRSLLAVGLFQLSNSRMPDYAVVSQTVEAARLLRRPRLVPLVNAVLRRFVRDRIAEQSPSNDEATHNHPRWLLEMLAADWPDDWQEIAAANNDRAPMWVRVNAVRGVAADYLQQLRRAGIDAELFNAAPQALRLIDAQSVEELPGFATGEVSVQDAAAQLAAPWLLAGQRCDLGKLRVLDACAAPGGKSGHLLELGGDRIDLTCIDNDVSRLELVSRNLERLGFVATQMSADASNPEEWWDQVPYDGILLDAPCSASGVIRRHPDIKHLRRAADIAQFAAIQSAMLDALWPMLKPGGRLLYVTCSVLATENDAVVARFLEGHDDAEENDVLQNNNIRDLMRVKACGYQILPGTHGLDGFYFACLEKVS